MAHTFSYAVLTATPDPRRGERVNVGLVVFRPDRLDVRFKHASHKLRALTGSGWEAHIETAERRLEGLFSPGGQAAEMLREFELLEPLLRPSDLGWLSALDDRDYEDKLAEIIAALIGPPPRERHERQSRINTEIAVEFRGAKVLAKSGEGIETGRVVRNFPIAPSEGLAADFARRNGRMYVASTLDLRRATASLADAALKSIILDKSEEVYGTEVKTIGVYAVEDSMRENFHSHIELLGDYADELFDWGDPASQWRFKKTFYDASPPAIFKPS
jgi:hypothetical protein